MEEYEIFDINENGYDDYLFEKAREERAEREIEKLEKELEQEVKKEGMTSWEYQVAMADRLMQEMNKK